MQKFNFIKTLTARVALALAIYPQAFAADTGSCGTNCRYTYSNGTLTFSPIDSSQGAIISNSTHGYNLSGDVVNVTISEGITQVTQAGNYDTIYNLGDGAGTLILPKSLSSLSAFSFHGLNFKTIEINSENLTLGKWTMGFDNSADTTIVLSPDQNITFDNFCLWSDNKYYFPASITIACKGNPDACRSKFGASLNNMDQDKVSFGYYQEKDSQENVTLQYFDDGYRKINDDGFYDVYDFEDNLIGYSNLDGTEIYDESGKILAKYDTEGNQTGFYKYDGAGNLTAAYENGVATYNRTSYTPSEAAKAVKKGNVNKVTLTFK